MLLTERESAISIIKALSNELRDRYAARAPIERLEDPAMRRAALEEAVRLYGTTVEEYLAVLRDDPGLAELERESTRRAVVGTTDPGPYDAISRESPSGQPGDLTKPRTLPRRAAPGGS